jgi:hypothetical protein
VDHEHSCSANWAYVTLLKHNVFLCWLQVSPTECFLRFLQLPDSDSVAVDLKQAAVVIMSHLDRLAAPHAPPATFTKVSYGTPVVVNL